MSRPKRRERSSVIELRSYPITMKRAGTANEAPRLEGYAAVFNRETVLVPADAWYEGSPEIREKIDMGAFKRSIKNSDQRAVWNHNTDIVLGRRKNNTLTLSEDEHGLRTEIVPPETDLVRDMVLAPIDRGDVDQMSFAFRVIDDVVTEERGRITITLRELDLIEVSPVAIPAYTDTEIALSARSADRIEEFRSKYADPVQQDQNHSAVVEAMDSSANHAHSEQSDPVNLRHLDECLQLERELEMESFSIQ